MFISLRTFEIKMFHNSFFKYFFTFKITFYFVQINFQFSISFCQQHTLKTDEQFIFYPKFGEKLFRVTNSLNNIFPKHYEFNYIWHLQTAEQSFEWGKSQQLGILIKNKFFFKKMNLKTFKIWFSSIWKLKWGAFILKS